MDHYLIVQRWRPYFSFNADISRNIVVWVRIPKLPPKLCNYQFLKRIGSTIGTLLKIEKLASIHDKGQFARICFELDLDRKLSSHIIIRGVKLPIEYEGLHSICFRCGKYGHKLDQCRELLEVQEDKHTLDLTMFQTKTSQQPITPPETGANNNEISPMSVLDEAAQTRLVEDRSENNLTDLQMGPWNLVIGRKSQPTKQSHTNRGNERRQTQPVNGNQVKPTSEMPQTKIKAGNDNASPQQNMNISLQSHLKGKAGNPFSNSSNNLVSNTPKYHSTMAIYDISLTNDASSDAPKIVLGNPMIYQM